MKKAILMIGFIFLFSVIISAVPGDLDTSFGNTGKVIKELNNSSDDPGQAVVIDSSNRVILAGNVYNGTDYDFAVFRYNSDGSRDTNFGSSGTVTTDFNLGDDYGFAVAIDSSGRIIVAGYAHNGTDNDFAVARYNADGTLDTSFNTDGKVTVSLSTSDDYGRSVAIDSNGKIIVAGRSDRSFGVARFNTDGSLDTSFSSDGLVTTDITINNDSGESVAIDSNGKIVVAGTAPSPVTQQDFTVVRYNTDGSLDNTFGSSGITTVDVNSTSNLAQAVAIASDGKMIVAGYSTTVSGADFTVMRFNTDGSLDTGFDTDGIVTTDFNSSSDVGTAVALDSTGIVVGGLSNGDFALAKYNSDGSLDTSYGSGGKVTTDFFGADDLINGIAVDSFDRVVAAGSTTFTINFGASPFNLAVARYQAASFVITKNADTNDGSCDAADCSLREAIAAANTANTDDTITFDPSLAGQTITLTLGELSIADNGTLNIIGLGADQLTVSGNNASRVFRLEGSGTPNGATATIDGLTIADGDVSSNSNPNAGGGGIHIKIGATLTLTNSTISSNTAKFAGGILVQGQLSLLNSTVTGNAATESEGGGIQNNNTLVITNSTISGNTAEIAGGGISTYQSQLTIVDSTISGNGANGFGGGGLNVDADFAGSIVNLKNTIIANSTSGGDCVNINDSNVTLNAEFVLIEDGLNCVNGINSNNLTGDPKLAPLGDYGGSTQTHALLQGSPAIDKGDSASTTDQRGFTRPINQFQSNTSDGSDIGAFELQLVTNDVGLESDVFTRFSGDGVIDSDDIDLLRQFLTDAIDRNLEFNEFQRIDSAPFNTLGDGCFDAADIVQAKLYQIGFNSTQTTRGPTLSAGCGVSFSESVGGKSKANVGTNRVIKVESTSGSAGNQVTVNILADAQGDESEYGFAVNFNSSVLTYQSTAVGNVNAGSTTCNLSSIDRLKCSVGDFPNTGGATPIGEIALGDDQILARITFNIAATAVPNTTTNLTLNGVSGAIDIAQSLPMFPSNGTVTILGTTAAGVTVAGRVLTQTGRGMPRAIVQMTDDQGNIRQARTNPFGYYRFKDVGSGGTYIFNVFAKGQYFEPQVVSISEGITNLNFTAAK